MADRNARLPENISGRFYVDRQCINCEVCRDIAPDNFRQVAAKRYIVVFKQPESEIEESWCREAMECCPVDAIGSDGQ